MYDVVIIGNGPAGISAAIYLKRANKKVLIISKESSALKRAEKIENYYGILSVSGEELYKNGIEQARRLGIDMKEEEVINISYNEKNNVFITDTVDGNYESSKLILATGTNRITPRINGIKEFEGKGISYCAICDAFFYRNKNIAVIGNGNYALHEAKILKPIANSVIILTNGNKIIESKDAEEFEVKETVIKEIKGNGKLEEIEFVNNDVEKIDGIFIAIGTASSVDLAKKIGALVKNNQIIVDDKMESTVKGLYACGDCTGGLLQVNKAVYEGAKAALSIINDK